MSDWLGRLVRTAGYEGPIDQFIAYSDYDEFLVPPAVQPPAAPRVLFVGMLERYKAVDVLLDAWPMVREKVPSARLTMIGAGSMRDEVVERLADDGLTGSVELLDPVERPEVRRHLDASTCLVLPSCSEGLGRVVLEAMGRERPVVASAVGGIMELVDPGRTGRPGPAGGSRGPG